MTSQTKPTLTKKKTDQDYSQFQDPRLKSFKNFLFLIWKHLGIPNPTEIQYILSEDISNKELKRLIIEAFRGEGKSWIAAAYVLYILYWNQHAKFLVVSASANHAQDFSIFVKQLILEVPELIWMYPTRLQRQSNIGFDVRFASPDKAPSVKSVGITGQLTGTRADYIIADDIEVLNNSETASKREKLLEQVKEFDNIIKPNGRIIYLGTPQTLESIYTVLEDRGYITKVYPAIFPDTQEVEVYGGRLAPYIKDKLIANPEIVGTPTDPDRFKKHDLEARKLSLGASTFRLQFMLDTTLSDANRYPLKVSDIIITDLEKDGAKERYIWSKNPNNELHSLPSVGLKGDKYYNSSEELGSHIQYTQKMLIIDPSGSGGDETAYVIIAHRDGYIFLLKCGACASGYGDDTLSELARLAKDFKVNLIKAEKNFGDGMFSRLLSPKLQDIGYPCRIEEVWNNTQKELRIIDTIEPILNQHRLVVCRSVVEDDYNKTQEKYKTTASTGIEYMLFYQLTHITKDRNSLKHDDRLDALAIGIAHFSEYMAIDAKRKQDERYQEERRKIFEDRMKNIKGGVGKKSRFKNVLRKSSRFLY